MALVGSPYGPMRYPCEAKSPGEWSVLQLFLLDTFGDAGWKLHAKNVQHPVYLIRRWRLHGCTLGCASFGRSLARDTGVRVVSRRVTAPLLRSLAK